jgi:hypothetical protein
MVWLVRGVHEESPIIRQCFKIYAIENPSGHWQIRLLLQRSIPLMDVFTLCGQVCKKGLSRTYISTLSEPEAREPFEAE